MAILGVWHHTGPSVMLRKLSLSYTKPWMSGSGPSSSLTPYSCSGPPVRLSTSSMSCSLWSFVFPAAMSSSMLSTPLPVTTCRFRSCRVTATASNSLTWKASSSLAMACWIHCLFTNRASSTAATTRRNTSSAVLWQPTGRPAVPLGSSARSGLRRKIAVSELGFVPSSSWGWSSAFVIGSRIQTLPRQIWRLGWANPNGASPQLSPHVMAQAELMWASALQG